MREREREEESFRPGATNRNNDRKREKSIFWLLFKHLIVLSRIEQRAIKEKKKKGLGDKSN